MPKKKRKEQAPRPGFQLDPTGIGPKGGLLPDFQPTLDRLNAILDGLKDAPAKVDALLVGLQGVAPHIVELLKQVESQGFQVTVNVRLLAANHGPYPVPLKKKK